MRVLQRTERAKGGLVAAALALFAPLALFASPASAQITYYAPGDGTPNVWSTTIPVTASIGGVCGFATAPSGTYDVGEVDVDTWTHDFPFTLLCTVPSRVAVVSQNGGLKTPLGTPVPGYTNVAPYTVTLNLDGDTTAVNQACQVETLTASASAPCAFRGPSSSTAGLRLNDSSVSEPDSYLRVNAPAYAGTDTLISGLYADTLIITVSASP